MSPAAHAVRAAKNVVRWGGYATGRYLINRGCDIGLFLTACAFERRRIERRQQAQLAEPIRGVSL